MDIEALKAAFAEMDKDGNGWLSRDEFKKMLEDMGCPVDKETVDGWLDMADANKDGKIVLDEFIKLAQ